MAFFTKQDHLKAKIDHTLHFLLDENGRDPALQAKLLSEIEIIQQRIPQDDQTLKSLITIAEKNGIHIPAMGASPNPFGFFSGTQDLSVPDDFDDDIENEDEDDFIKDSDDDVAPSGP